MASAVSGMELQKETNMKWELALQLLKKMNLTNLLNFKHGWQRFDDLEDTKQDMVLIIFNAIQKYENKTGKTFKNFTDITEEDYSSIKRAVVFQYRKDVWNSRIDRNMRLSDVYNIDHSTDDDARLYFSTMSENDIVDSNTVYTNQVYDNADKNELRIKLCNNLISILKPELAKMIDANILGNNIKGLQTHREIAVNSSKCRSAVTRRINRGLQTLNNFISKYNISLRQINNPTKDDFIMISQIIQEYKNKKLFKKQKIKINTSMLNVEYFLKANKCFIVSSKRENDILQPLFPKKQKRKSVKNIEIKVHTIEEFLC